MKTVLFFMLMLNRAANALIIGGVDMTAHDPIQRSTAAIYEPSSNGVGGALCTASLIGKNTALTAAHCVQKGAYSPVMIFGPNVRSPDSVHLPVTGVAVNPDWQKKRGRGMDQGDIAVVKFGGKLPSGYHAATLDSPKTEIKKGDTAILAGYGVSNAQTHEGAGILRKTSVSVDSPRKGKSEMIFNQSRGHGACHGDSGGPAYFQRGRKMILGGVTNRSYPNSAADDCAHKVVYTKVSAYRPWIEQSENELNNNQRPVSTPSLAKNDASNKVTSAKRQLSKKIGAKAIKPYLVKKSKNTSARKPRHQLARHQHARRAVAKQKTVLHRVQRTAKSKKSLS